jgi:hypothetical protein
LTHLLYIDPGSGSILFQIIIAGVLGALFFLKSVYGKIKTVSVAASGRLYSILQTKGLHPFFIIVFFVLHETKEVLILFDLSRVLLYTLTVLAVSCILFLLLYLAIRSAIKSAIILSVFLLLFLLYEPIYGYLLSLPFLQYSFMKMGYLIVLAFSATASLTWISRKKLSGLNTYLNILFMVLIIAEGSLATYNYFVNLPNKNLIEETDSPTQSNAASETPVIYHILLDAYTSTASLKKYWGYDNSELENFLHSSGFYIASNAKSNATATQQSMATTFNMRYLSNMDSIFNNDLLSTSVYRNLIRNSRLIKELSSRNYALVNLSIFDIGNCSKFHRSGVLADGTDLLRILIEDTHLERFVKNAPYADLRSNLEVFDRLKKLPETISGSRVFVYAHINMPHDALCDRNGNPFGSTFHGDEKKKYIETVAYTNKLLMETIKKILSTSKAPPVIIIHGDHGSRMFDAEEKHTVLSAYYFPDKDYGMLYDSISPVNSYRVICKKYFKENSGLLPDKNY